METKPARLAVLIRPPGIIVAVTLDRYPTVPRPITVDITALFSADVLTRPAKLAVDIRLAKFAVDTKFVKLAVDTKFVKLAVDTNPPYAGILDRYPIVPRPITVLVSCVAK